MKSRPLSKGVSKRTSGWWPQVLYASPRAARLRSAAPTQRRRRRIARHRVMGRNGNDNEAATRRRLPYRNERIVAIYSSAYRHVAAWRRGDVGRLSRLLVAAGFRPAAG